MVASPTTQPHPYLTSTPFHASSTTTCDDSSYEYITLEEAGPRLLKDNYLRRNKMALVLPLAPFDEHSKTSQITVSIDISPDSSLTSIKDHVTVMRALQNGDYSNEEAIEALPHRRRPRSQRPLALQIAKAIYPDLTELQAIILYESLVKTAKSTVRRRQADRLANDLKPKTNAGGKLMVIQGPWAGQEADPVDLNGPVAIPMPVAFGQAHDFKAIFEFLSQDIPFSATKQQDSKSYSLPNNQSVGGMHGYELMWDTPMLEFEKGIVYEDGRLDLCKKVVGTVHIGSLMESLESNHQIRHFLLGNNAISTTGAKAIADFLHKYPNRMETWYVAGCHLTRQALSLLVPEMVSILSSLDLCTFPSLISDPQLVEYFSK